jgi:hypothetical protein
VGKNVIAAWGQVFTGQHAHGVLENKGFILAMKARQHDGREFGIVTDGSWKGTITEQDGWEQIGFDDSNWQLAAVLGRMGAAPWGSKPLENIGAATEPRHHLAIDLPSPYIECFKEVPDIAYDVKPQGEKRIGWYRFAAPPGLCRLLLNTRAKAKVWVNGVKAKVRSGVASIAKPPAGVSTVAIRLEMEHGAYGGAAFPVPIGLQLQGGTIQLGEWSKYALPTYSGIGVYEQKVNFTADEIKCRTVLDLGRVLVAAEVLINGKSAGIRLARPFKFDITKLLRKGENTLEVRVANTIAPHYTVTNKVESLGPTTSGLIGPVRLKLIPR